MNKETVSLSSFFIDFMRTHSRVTIKVRTNAKKTEIRSFSDDVFVVAVSAQPEHNKANIALIKYLSSLLKKKVNIVTGLTSKTKTIKIVE